MKMMKKTHDFLLAVRLAVPFFMFMHITYPQQACSNSKLCSLEAANFHPKSCKMFTAGFHWFLAIMEETQMSVKTSKFT